MTRRANDWVLFLKTCASTMYGKMKKNRTLKCKAKFEDALPKERVYGFLPGRGGFRKLYSEFAEDEDFGIDPTPEDPFGIPILRRKKNIILDVRDQRRKKEEERANARKSVRNRRSQGPEPGDDDEDEIQDLGSRSPRSEDDELVPRKRKPKRGRRTGSRQGKSDGPDDDDDDIGFFPSPGGKAADDDGGFLPSPSGKGKDGKRKYTFTSADRELLGMGKSDDDDDLLNGNYNFTSKDVDFILNGKGSGKGFKGYSPKELDLLRGKLSAPSGKTPPSAANRRTLSTTKGKTVPLLISDEGLEFSVKKGRWTEMMFKELEEQLTKLCGFKNNSYLDSLTYSNFKDAYTRGETRYADPYQWITFYKKRDFGKLLGTFIYVKFKPQEKKAKLKISLREIPKSAFKDEKALNDEWKDLGKKLSKNSTVEEDMNFFKPVRRDAELSILCFGRNNKTDTKNAMKIGLDAMKSDNGGKPLLFTLRAASAGSGEYNMRLLNYYVDEKSNLNTVLASGHLKPHWAIENDDKSYRIFLVFVGNY